MKDTFKVLEHAVAVLKNNRDFIAYGTPPKKYIGLNDGAAQMKEEILFHSDVGTVLTQCKNVANSCDTLVTEYNMQAIELIICRDDILSCAANLSSCANDLEEAQKK